MVCVHTLLEEQLCFFFNLLYGYSLPVTHYVRLKGVVLRLLRERLELRISILSWLFHVMGFPVGAELCVRTISLF